MNQVLDAADTDVAWNPMYRVGAAAAVIAALIIRRNLDAEWLLFRNLGVITTGPIAPPGPVLGWFMLLQSNTLLGLTLLKLFDIVNYGLVGLMFLALCVALRQVNRSLVVLAATLSFWGIAVYLATNQAITMLSLSSQYSTASTDTGRAMFLAAGQAVLAIHKNNNYPGVYISFLLVTVAGLMISAVMLQSRVFGKGAAFTGILANAFGLGYYIAWALAPTLEFIPISISAVFLLAWYLLIGFRLCRLGQASHPGAE